MTHVEDDRLAVRDYGDLRFRHIAATEGVNARLAVSAGNFLSNRCAVKKALNIRQEGDEFLVAPFLNLRRFRAEVIDDPTPLVAGLDFLQRSPVALNLFARPER
jgi:hypothetical protein